MTIYNLMIISSIEQLNNYNILIFEYHNKMKMKFSINVEPDVQLCVCTCRSRLEMYLMFYEQLIVIWYCLQRIQLGVRVVVPSYWWYIFTFHVDVDVLEYTWFIGITLTHPHSWADSMYKLYIRMRWLNHSYSSSSSKLSLLNVCDRIYTYIPIT